MPLRPPSPRRTGFPILAALLAGLFSPNVPGQAADAPPGRNLAATCANCHGTNGHSLGGMPPLAGMPQATLILKFKAFATGAAPATIMHQLAKAYSDAQLAQIAAYFAAQPSTPETPPND